MTIKARFHHSVYFRVLWQIVPWAWASAGGSKTGMCPPLEIETKKQKFLVNVKSGIQFWLFGLILAMTVCLPIWHSHCTTIRFTVLITCSRELAIRSCPLIACRAGCETRERIVLLWPLLRNNNTSSYCGRRFAACNYWMQTPWQVMQRNSDCS